MSRGGARPGAGGPRGPRGPHKRTIERATIAKRTIEEAQATGKKLGKEVLEDFMHLFAGMAAHYQPAPPNAPQNEHQDEPRFFEAAKLAIHCAEKLTPFQSPTFRAVIIAPPPDPRPDQNRKLITLSIFEGGSSRTKEGELLVPPQRPYKAPTNGGGNGSAGAP